MDLLDRVGQKGRNKNSPDRKGLFQPQRRKAATLLLAWLSASLRSTAFTYQKGEQSIVRSARELSAWVKSSSEGDEHVG